MHQPPSPHVIRLREPWERQVATDAEKATPENQPHPKSGECGVTIRFSRRFGLPTGLQTGDRIELVLETISVSGRVSLNDVPLGEISAGESLTKLDLTGRLQNRNLLVIDFFPANSQQGPAGNSLSLSEFVAEVRLEIHSSVRC